MYRGTVSSHLLISVILFLCLYVDLGSCRLNCTASSGLRRLSICRGGRMMLTDSANQQQPSNLGQTLQSRLKDRVFNERLAALLSDTGRSDGESILPSDWSSEDKRSFHTANQFETRNIILPFPTEQPVVRQSNRRLRRLLAMLEQELS